MEQKIDQMLVKIVEREGYSIWTTPEYYKKHEEAIIFQENLPRKERQEIRTYLRVAKGQNLD